MESAPAIAGSIRVSERVEPAEGSFGSGCKYEESQGTLSELRTRQDRKGRC